MQVDTSLITTPSRNRSTRRSTYLIGPLIALAMMAAVCSGCAAADRAPFHMYKSPLLEGRVQARYPSSRSFDPLQPGDYDEPSTAYAASDSTGGGPPAPTDQSGAPSSADRSTADQLPAVSANVHSGGPAGAQSSSRPAAGAEAAPAADHDTPALAAAYMWSTYRANDIAFSADARYSVPALFGECKKRGHISHSSRPAIGDLVFFHNTGDFNHDSRNNDWYTHVALVESVGDDGRITLLGYRGGQVERVVMDLQHPRSAQTPGGQVANSKLRPHRSDDPPYTQYRAGQLFAGTCSVLGDRGEMVVIDHWNPAANAPASN